MGPRRDEKKLRADVDPIVAQLAVAFASLSELARSVSDDPAGSQRPLELYREVRAHIRPVTASVETLLRTYNAIISAPVHTIDGHVAMDAALSIELLSSRLAAVEMVAAALVMLRATEGHDEQMLRLAIDTGTSVADTFAEMLVSVRAAKGANIVPVYQLWKEDPMGVRAGFQQMANRVRAFWDRVADEAKSGEHSPVRDLWDRLQAEANSEE